MPTMKPRDFRVVYTTRQGFKHTTTATAFNIPHAISTVQELEPTCHRVLSVLEQGMWQ